MQSLLVSRKHAENLKFHDQPFMNGKRDTTKKASQVYTQEHLPQKATHE